MLKPNAQLVARRPPRPVKTSGLLYVVYLSFLCLFSVPFVLQLRRTFRAIQAIINHTGWNWCDEKGGNIQPDQATAWSSFCDTHKEAKPFRNRGWDHLERVSEIMPATVRGANVFCPSRALTGLDQGYDHEDTPEALQEEPATQDTTSEKSENDVTSDDAPSQVSHNSAILFTIVYIQRTYFLFSSSLLPPPHSFGPLHLLLASVSVLYLKPHPLPQKRERPLVRRQSKG